MRDALLIEQLRADFDKARRVRDGARRRVSDVTRDLPDLESRISELEGFIASSQAEHDILQRHADRQFARGNAAKALTKVKRRNEHGEAVKRANIEREALLLDRRRKLVEAESLRNLLELPRLNEAYVVARHHLLKAIAEGDSDERALDTKVVWAQRAQLPWTFASNPESVWHYETFDEHGEISEIHFFYGGRTAPTYIGDSPDGDGHGHHILVRRNSELVLDYFRLPQSV